MAGSQTPNNFKIELIKGGLQLIGSLHIGAEQARLRNCFGEVFEQFILEFRVRDGRSIAKNVLHFKAVADKLIRDHWKAMALVRIALRTHQRHSMSLLHPGFDSADAGFE